MCKWLEWRTLRASNWLEHVQERLRRLAIQQRRADQRWVRPLCVCVACPSSSHHLRGIHGSRGDFVLLRLHGDEQPQCGCVMVEQMQSPLEKMRCVKSDLKAMH
eukprot:gnl/TRDRNA2_/TRDRNA2_63103_c0_seq1.p1 gnl/TRDRNA2_/TRDRNA2_63103_c0~~gnl/TRDRNA2_/TRDRNA2_63103_c0_seq1.p1  ORF type:complete len:104 (-),score=8.45 gnl/TRDRNA2_/TRDRNA2_63103_c0_seq1:180-491(-)